VTTGAVVVVVEETEGGVEADVVVMGVVGGLSVVGGNAVVTGAVVVTIAGRTVVAVVAGGKVVAFCFLT
jgi:hypothetical protein